MPENESVVDPILSTNMGDDSASLLGDEDCQSTNIHIHIYICIYICIYIYIYISHKVIHIVIGNNPLSGKAM